MRTLPEMQIFAANERTASIDGVESAPFPVARDGDHEPFFGDSLGKERVCRLLARRSEAFTAHLLEEG